jgi:hypothetical protein
MMENKNSNSRVYNKYIITIPLCPRKVEIYIKEKNSSQALEKKGE